MTPEEVKIKTSVSLFAAAMEEKLTLNAHNGGWDDWPIEYLIRRLEEETCELKMAIRGGARATAIVKKAADVANFAMMLAERHKS